jgi:hypothetical protein
VSQPLAVGEVGASESESAGAGRRRLAPDQHGHGRGARGPSRAGSRVTFVNCPVIGTRETAKLGRLIVLASGPGDALDRARPIFDAIASKTVGLEPEAGRVSRMKLVATAWAVGIVEGLRAQLGRAARSA